MEERTLDSVWPRGLSGNRYAYGDSFGGRIVWGVEQVGCCKVKWAASFCDGTTSISMSGGDPLPSGFTVADVDGWIEKAKKLAADLRDMMEAKDRVATLEAQVKNYRDSEGARAKAEGERLLQDSVIDQQREAQITSLHNHIRRLYAEVAAARMAVVQQAAFIVSEAGRDDDDELDDGLDDEI